MGRSDTCGSLLGTTFSSRRWLSLDPCGLCCVTFSFSIHAFALFVIPTHLISHSSAAQTLFVAAYCPAAVLALSSLFTAWTTDPGVVPMGARPLPVSTTTSKDEGGGDEEAPVPTSRRRGIRRCRKCNDNYKPPRAHHDSVTGRCIVKMDHFCPWVGNAVGALNHKFFFLFILYTMITSVLSLILLLTRFVRCGYVTEVSPHNNGEADPISAAGEGNGTSTSVGEENETAPEQEGDALDPNFRNLDDSSADDNMDFKYPGCEQLFALPVLILFVVTVAFLIFTCAMLVEQIDAIRSNTSKIARMKMRAGSADAAELGRVTTDFNEMFGGGPGWFSVGFEGRGNANPAWHWFLPLRVRFPDGTHDGIMGYEYDPSWGQLPYREPEDDGRGGGVGADGGGSKIIAGGAPSSSSSVASLPGQPVVEPPLASPENGESVEESFVQEAVVGSSSEASVPTRKASTTTQARKRNKPESGDNDKTMPSIV
uniref:Palmitoyltransferase n=1 Tax=Odontella aurita TaxID=265563 RepID=A0A7S4HWD8_9STRA|mmetsp:Transcript_16254/g.46844  ORF Transcript_16254/g.46844 Transcript_16254/m.46844 type:complete len:483 (+) Transcript_16254:162-1610(+)